MDNLKSFLEKNFGRFGRKICFFLPEKVKSIKYNQLFYFLHCDIEKMEKNYSANEIAEYIEEFLKFYMPKIGM